MKKIKGNKAITLVALVITIIILLILAGITISQLANNGLFDKSKEAKQKYENVQDDENDKITKYENEINRYISANRDTVTISQEEYQKLLNSSNANNFSLEEKIVGTWIDGKTLYQKTVHCGKAPASATDSNLWYSCGTGIDHLHLVEGHAIVNTDVTSLPYDAGANGQVSINTYVYENNGTRTGYVGITTFKDRSGFDIYATIQYTKITD